MRKIWLVIKREFLTRVKTKGFVFGTVIVPVLGVGFALLIAFIGSHQPSENLRLAIVDNTGGLAPSVARSLKKRAEETKPAITVLESVERPAQPDTLEQGLRDRINKGTLDAFLVIPRDLKEAA